MINITKRNGRQFPKWRPLFLLLLGFLLQLLPLDSFAHPSPNTLIFLDISPDRVSVELQIPLPELALSFGHGITKNPETVVEEFGPQLREYLKAHIHPYINSSQPWQVEINDMRMTQGQPIDNGPLYWEIIVQLVLIPQPGENTRAFFLDYDVVMHEVVNHVAIVSVRSDWENGSTDNQLVEPGVISRDMNDNLIHPFKIDVKEGTWWKGFGGMLSLGMEHIREGTDHLLFLIVLLLPAPLLISNKRWSAFGGIKYSILRLIKIVTAFTIGHSITLLVAASGLVRLPSQPVEILIAVSILVSAIHAIRPLFPGKEIYVAGGFGLIHGLAFASILANLNLGTAAMALSISGFNVGIEIMQLFVVVLIMPWLILLSRTPVYDVIRIAGSIVAGIAAFSWIIERISGNTNRLSGWIQNVTPYAYWGIIALAIFSITAYGLYYRKLKSSQ